jgi:pseudouridine synthase
MAERLQKLISQAGIASRRAAEELIEQGRVTVNGKQATLGDKADPSVDEVRVDGEKLKLTVKRVYLMINKPKGVVSTTRAQQQDLRRTVSDLVGLNEFLYPVGRLDADSEGLMLLTNDGELAEKLSHPRYEHPKVYEVIVYGQITDDRLEVWRRGVVLEEDGPEPTLPADVQVLKYANGLTTLRVRMSEGRKRQIRRIASLLGYPVRALTRIEFDTLKLGNLNKGEWRYLTDEEIAVLKTSAETLSPARRASRVARVKQSLGVRDSDSPRRPSPLRAAPYGARRSGYGDREERGGREDRPRRDFRPDRGERPERSFDLPEREAGEGDPRDTNIAASGDRRYEDRGGREDRRPSDRGERGFRPRFGERNDRPRRDFRPDRGERPEGSFDRPKREAGEGDPRDTNIAAGRRFAASGDRRYEDRGGREDRPRYAERRQSDRGERGFRPRSDERDERPRRDFRPDRGERPEREAGEGDPRDTNIAAGRRFSASGERRYEGRGGREDRRPSNRGEHGFRPRFGERNDRPRRDFRPDRGEGPEREAGEGDPRDTNIAAGRRFATSGERRYEDRGDRGERGFRPRSGERDDRPRRPFRSDRPARSFDRPDRGERPERAEDRPERTERRAGGSEDRPRRPRAARPSGRPAGRSGPRTGGGAGRSTSGRKPGGRPGGPRRAGPGKPGGAGGRPRKPARRNDR